MDEQETVKVCGVCGYTLTNCVGHPGVHPSVLAKSVREVPRKSEDHTRALSSHARQHAHWDNRIKASNAHH